jgi:hypothetical protein
MRGLALICLRVSAWLSLLIGVFACFNSYIQVQETSDSVSSVIAHFFFDAFPFLLGGVTVWAFLLLAAEGFEQIDVVYNRIRQSNAHE